MPKSNEPHSEVANIGKSVVIKGELSGSEDLYVDGEVEGSIEMRGHNLTIGPHGRVRGQMRAKNVTIDGKVDGNVTADRVELKKSAIHVGDIVTQRIIIEDGAFFKGSVDIQREQKVEAKPEIKPPMAAVASVATPAQAPATVATPPPSLAEQKR